MKRRIIQIDADRCDGCGACEMFCPLEAVTVTDGAAALVEERLCDGLGACLDVCPRGAIRLEVRDAPPFEPPAETPADAAKTTPLLTERLAACCHASNCGRLCPRLIKQPGKTGVWCVDLAAHTSTDLYAALSDPAFHCPEGRF